MFFNTLKISIYRGEAWHAITLTFCVESVWLRDRLGTHRSGAHCPREGTYETFSFREHLYLTELEIRNIRDSNSRGLGLLNLTQGGNFYLQHWTSVSWRSFSAPRVGPGYSQLAPNTVRTGHLGTDAKPAVR